MLTLFLFGTVWFWLLAALVVLTVGVFIARESFGKATLSLVAFFALLAFCGDFNVLHWLKTHAFEAAVYGAGYFAAGTGWAIWKWWFFVRRLRDKYNELKTQFLQQHDVADGPIPDRLKAAWLQWFTQYGAREFTGERYDGFNGNVRSATPKARNYKGKITSWMIYWPWSLIVTMIDDPIRRLFRAIYTAIQDMLQSISDKAFAGTDDYFKAAAAPTAPPAAPGGPGATHDVPDAAPGNGASPQNPPRRETRGGHDTF